MGVERLEQGADATRGVAELRIPLAEDGGGAGCRPDEPENRAHRRRLARSVRAEEAGDLPRMDRKREVVDCEGRAELFAEALDLDHARTLT
jgi:hypothetical protein